MRWEERSERKLCRPSLLMGDGSGYLKVGTAATTRRRRRRRRRVEGLGFRG